MFENWEFQIIPKTWGFGQDEQDQKDFLILFILLSCQIFGEDNKYPLRNEITTRNT